MEEYLEDIKKATQVDEQYKKWVDSYYERHYPNDAPKWMSMKESVFCYEFYKNFRQTMEGNLAKYGNLCFHAEITKRLSETGKEIYFPDFVLHGGQDNSDKQLIVIEVKISDRIPDNKTGQENLLEDVKALIAYIEELKYEMGLFICVNKTTTDLRENVKCVYELNKDKELKTDDNTLGKIYFIGTDSENEEIEHFTLLDVSKSE